MKIEIEIKSCSDCQHSDHTGAFTKGGAKPCCNHPHTVASEGCDCFRRVVPYKSVVDEIRPVRKYNIPKSIPKWCPLLNGHSYQL